MKSTKIIILKKFFFLITHILPLYRKRIQIYIYLNLLLIKQIKEVLHFVYESYQSYIVRMIEIKKTKEKGKNKLILILFTKDS